VKKSKYKKKKKQKFLKFLKDYATIITIGITILAAIFNAIIQYYEKTESTEFVFQYITVNISDENWITEYQEHFKENFFSNDLKSPTLNNSLNKALYLYPEKMKGYFLTYLVIEQKQKYDALNVKLNFQQYVSAESLEQGTMNELALETEDYRNIMEEIEYPFPQGEKLKIPISICQTQYATDFGDCYYMKLIPISIEYKNKYWFSKREIQIRPYIEHNVIIDGEVVSGKGSTQEEESRPWYLK